MDNSEKIKEEYGIDFNKKLYVDSMVLKIVSIFITIIITILFWIFGINENFIFGVGASLFVTVVFLWFESIVKFIKDYDYERNEFILMINNIHLLFNKNKITAEEYINELQVEVIKSINKFRTYSISDEFFTIFRMCSQLFIKSQSILLTNKDNYQKEINKCLLIESKSTYDWDGIMIKARENFNNSLEEISIDDLYIFNAETSEGDISKNILSSVSNSIRKRMDCIIQSNCEYKKVRKKAIKLYFSIFFESLIKPLTLLIFIITLILFMYA